MDMKKRSTTEWLELIGEQEASGQTQTSWCKAKGINLYTFRDRKSALRGLHSRSLIESKSKEAVWLPISEASHGDCSTEAIEVKIGSFIIMIDEKFNEAAFSRVCEILMQLC